MQLHQLPSTVQRSKKRLGRGYGSGKGGHTSSRGQKGQKTRGKIPTWFEGGQLPLIRRTPFIKGKSRMDPTSLKPLLVSLTQLNKFADDSIVDIDAVVTTLKYDAKNAKRQLVKVLNQGKLEKALTVKLIASKGAQTAIEKAGGKVE